MRDKYLMLTAEEILVLDGKCQEKTQKEVDQIKQENEAIARHPELSEGRAVMVARIVGAAKTLGVLRVDGVSLDECDACGREAKTKKIRRKDVRLPFGGVDLARGFITMQGRANVGCCKECFEAIKGALRQELDGVEAEIDEKVTGISPKWKKWNNRKCNKCGWEGHEGEMGLLPALMGNGDYRGECPKCAGKNLPLAFSTVIETRNGFTLVEVPVVIQEEKQGE